MRKEILFKYADILLNIGAKLKLQDVLLISIPVEQYTFAHILSEKAYALGASQVIVDYVDDTLVEQSMQFTSSQTYEANSPHAFRTEKWRYVCEKQGFLLMLDGRNFYDENKIKPERIVKSLEHHAKDFAFVTDYILKNNSRRCAAAVPTRAWAKKIYPSLEPDTAYQKLWDVILKVCEAYEDNPVASWKQHMVTLFSISTILKQKNYHSFHLLGKDTDLTVGMPDGISWGFTGTRQELLEIAERINVTNIPTQEVSSCPHRLKVNGYVSNTRPLYLNGNLIDEFKLHFENGCVTHFSAKVGYESLRKLLKFDEGASYIGEIAFVPIDSAIAKEQIFFYDILFDENAACHLALGCSYPSLFPDWENKSKEQLKDYGANFSNIHVDFAYSDANTTILGCYEDGRSEKIMESGLWTKEFLSYGKE